MDHSLDRIETAKKEEEGTCGADQGPDRAPLHAGLAGVDKYVEMAGTAQALGTMVTGDDPKTSVVDAHGQVCGMERLYWGDASVLARSSHVNPSLTAYAWGLRPGDHLAGF
ncbi:MAG: hypothetical protein GY798_19975 [Hyphomicrobiales bacterium]|nr:hypothetical protein [Hyphomicrobiales bacterium]